MKQILILLFIIPVICKAQEPTYNAARDLYEEHNTNIGLGRRALENTENKAVEASYALSMMLLSSGLGYPVDSVDYWKGVLDGIFGETTASFSITWGAVLVRERDLDTIYVDSISFDEGVTWYDSTDMANMLSAYYSIDTLTGDNELTSLLALKADQTAIDTLPGDNELTNALALKAPQTAVDTLPGDNELANALVLKANIASPTFTGTVTIPSPFTLGATSVTANGTELNVLDNIPAGLTSTELGYCDGVTSAIQTQLNAKAPQTAIDTLVGDNELAGQLDTLVGDNALTNALSEYGFGEVFIEGTPTQYKVATWYNDSTIQQVSTVSFYEDSSSFNAEAHFHDSIRCMNLIDGSEPRLAVITSTGAIDTGTFTAQSKALNLNLDFDDFYSVRKSGEINWMYYDSKGNLQKEYGLSKNPNILFSQLQAMHEITLGFVKELKDENESQQQRIETLEKENAELRKRLELIENKLGL